MHVRMLSRRHRPSADRQRDLYRYREALKRLWQLPISPVRAPLLCIAQPENTSEGGGGAFSNLDELLALSRQRNLPTRVRR